MEAFEKLEVWKRSSRLCVDIYKFLRYCRDRIFKDQATRAALSIPSNIAEGYERGSTADYIRFLHFAKASCAELRTQLYIGAEAGIVERMSALNFAREATDLTKMLQALINRLQHSKIKHWG
ncbi:MAG: four helix bundle protein [Gammaproteobacteria bacterium]